MLAQMSPETGPDTYVFVTVLRRPERLEPLMAFHEAEGLTLIVTVDQAQEHGWPVEHPMKRITLRVHSALYGVGLTAAFSAALAEVGIACNVVAGYHHDHLFVPEADAERAVVALRELSARNGDGGAQARTAPCP
jgi:hypothetical protein